MPQTFLTIFCLTLLFSGISSKEITVKKCGVSKVSPYLLDRIVGGENAKAGEFPWIVSIRELDEDFGFEHVCGGTILNENWIVTAAHCLVMPDSPEKYEILVGLHKLSQETASSARRYKISKMVIHPGFNDDTFEDDIALLKISRPIDISRSNGYVNGICLPQDKDDPRGYAIVAGWGYTKEDGENSDTLKKVVVPMIDRELCNEAYDENPNDNENAIFDTMICAGITGRDSCQNDSGGPLIQTDKNGVSTLIGVVSHGVGCGAKFFPGIYTKVSMYQNWLESIMS